MLCVRRDEKPTEREADKGKREPKKPQNLYVLDQKLGFL